MAFPDQDHARVSRPEPGSAHHEPSASAQPAQSPQPPAPAGRSGGTGGNERLTAVTGSVLLIMLVVECVTLLRLGSLISLHIFLGMMLLGPVTLKVASVSYRFVRYYAGSAPYRRKGPPEPLLRLTGVLIVASTVVLFASGIMLTLTGDKAWLIAHQMSFVAWACLMIVHLLTYAGRLPRLLAAEARGIASPDSGEGHAREAMRALGGRGIRLALLSASLLAGLLIALLTWHTMGGWTLG
ncbi:MAG TPA: hypothetical protein VK817_09550 [Trebonia sp.]|jgi:hypothetical protein|nr:hypothetical protein [Trebonia sp.]